MAMKQVGIFEAKTHLSSLLEEVEKGSEIVITRHGRPVARLVQPDIHTSVEAVERRSTAWRELREIGRQLNLSLASAEIRQRIDEGHR